MPRKIEVKNIEIDVPSFSDIAFLLIIFFILTTSLNRPMGRIIDMPSASTPDQQKSNATTPSVNILADRIMFVEGEGTGKEVTLSELRADLMSRGLASASESDRMVLLEVAPEVSYERYFQVITMISEAGGIVAMLTE
mgnify:CR=1 FL=1